MRREPVAGEGAAREGGEASASEAAQIRRGQPRAGEHGARLAQELSPFSLSMMAPAEPIEQAHRMPLLESRQRISDADWVRFIAAAAIVTCSRSPPRDEESELLERHAIDLQNRSIQRQ